VKTRFQAFAFKCVNLYRYDEVVTGCVRLAAEVSEVFGGGLGSAASGFGGGGGGGGGGSGDLGLGGDGGAGAQFLGPGEAVGEDSVLRGGRGSWESSGGGLGGHHHHHHHHPAAGGSPRTLQASMMASALNRTQVGLLQVEYS
jgi:hypothetical protein